MRLRVLMLRQDDPKKCTAARMVRFGLARGIRRVGGGALVLDPFSPDVLLPRDRRSATSLVGIDCSWRLAEQAFSGGFAGLRRRLPPLLAGNPVNYARPGMLTTAEAVCAGLVILGFRGQGLEILEKFGWGHTFYELNAGLLDGYSQARDAGDADSVAREYGLAP